MSAKQKLADKKLLAEHDSWRDWGEQFGWRLYGTNGRWSARFHLEDGSAFDIPERARQDIDVALFKARALQPSTPGGDR